MLIVVAVLLSLGIGVFVWKSIQQHPDNSSLIETSEETTEESLGGEIYEEVETPAGALPETNPLDADTNPFGDSSVNPFEGLNPFGQ